jgi:hypothetical protein
MDLRIEKVETGSHLKKFIKYPFHLYKGNEYWVPPLIRDEWRLLNPHENKLIENRDVIYLLAYRNSRIVGRIAGIVQDDGPSGSGHGDFARFGWFDFEDDPEVSEMLLAEIEKWAREKSQKSLEGPFGFTNLDKAGMLIMGFSELSTIATLYNYDYYPEHVERCGYKVGRNWLEYEFQVPDVIPEKYTKFSSLVATRYGLQQVQITTKKQLLDYADRIFQLLNQTHKDLYGFVPFSPEQVRAYKKNYLPLINPDFCSLVVNEDDDLVAFAVTMPSFSRVFQKIRGRLFPFGYWHISRAMKYANKADMYLIGVSPEMRNKGAHAPMFNKIIQAYIDMGVKTVESNPELEENRQVQTLWSGFEFRQHKKRRTYKKDLS